MSDFLKVVHAVKAGNSALAAWQKLEPVERIAKLNPLTDLLSNAKLSVAAELSKETGAPEVPVLDYLDAIKSSQRVLKLANELFAQTDVSHLPVGLVGLITGSQNPFSSSLSRILSALVVGNGVIWQPSPKVENTIAKLIQETFLKLDLPGGLITVLPSGGEEITQGLIDHPGIHQLMFVGSTTSGKAIYAKAAQAGKRIQLSMSARNPSIIFADANLDSNIDTIIQSFFDYHGLGRWRASRIFVQETIYKKFLEDLKSRLVEKLNYLGTLSANYKEKFDANFSQAISEKGKSLLQDDLSQVSPRVIFDLTNCSTLQQDEINGPMITVSSFKYQFDAVKYANTSPLGKAGYVWTGDPEKAKKVARKLEVGRVFINELPKSFIVDRYTAAKESGLGAEGIRDLIEFNSHTVNVT